MCAITDSARTPTARQLFPDSIVRLSRRILQPDSGIRSGSSFASAPYVEHQLVADSVQGLDGSATGRGKPTVRKSDHRPPLHALRMSHKCGMIFFRITNGMTRKPSRFVPTPPRSSVRIPPPSGGFFAGHRGNIAANVSVIFIPHLCDSRSLHARGPSGLVAPIRSSRSNVRLALRGRWNLKSDISTAPLLSVPGPE